MVEGANNPCSNEAQNELYERGVLLIPDFIANPGGIIAAYVEMTSDISPDENIKTRANVHRAKELTKSKIAENVRYVLSLSTSLNLNPVLAAKYYALKRIFSLT